MVQKRLGSRSGHTPRQIEDAYFKRRMAALGYESGCKAASKLGMTSQAFNRGYNKWVAKQPTSLGVAKEEVKKSDRAWINNLKIVSAAVKKGKEKGLKAEDIIAEVSTIEGLERSTVNKHIGKGLAGRRP